MSPTAIRVDGGTVRWGHETSVATSREEHDLGQNSNTTVIEWLAQFDPLAGQQTLRGLLGQMLFAAMTRPSPSKRSPAAKPRASFSAASCCSTDVLVFDEPTNHLDLESINALNIALQRYEGTVFLVTTTTTSSTKSPPASGTSIIGHIGRFQRGLTPTSNRPAAQSRPKPPCPPLKFSNFSNQRAFSPRASALLRTASFVRFVGRHCGYFSCKKDEPFAHHNNASQTRAKHSSHSSMLSFELCCPTVRNLQSQVLFIPQWRFFERRRSSCRTLPRGTV